MSIKETLELIGDFLVGSMRGIGVDSAVGEIRNQNGVQTLIFLETKDDGRIVEYEITMKERVK